MAHPATGPISPEEMQRIASLPYGKATEELRKHDPMFGVKPGDKIKWSVKVSGTASVEARTTVEAESEKEAIRLVELRPRHEFDWETVECDEFDVDWAIPA